MGAELVNRYRIIAVEQLITTPVTHANHEQLNLEVARCLPSRETSRIRFCEFSYSIGTLRTFRPCQHVFQKGDLESSALPRHCVRTQQYPP